MSDQKATIIRWFEEVWNHGRGETIDELLPEDCVVHDGDSDAKGPAAFIKGWPEARSTFRLSSVAKMNPAIH